MFSLKKLTGAVLLAATLLVASPTFAHTVEKGDTMYQLSREYGVSLNQLANWNPEVKNINLIFIGQNIRTTGSSPQQAVKAKETVEKQPEVTQVAASGEVDLLARIVRAEAQGESYAGKVAVAKVVLNRVASGQFPNSISGVIYQPGQFSPVANGSVNRAADNDSIKAARQAIAEGGNANGSLFFYNSATATNRWLDSRPTVEVIGNHTFKR